ncbi:MAG TPA: two-component regulator propeller domain-containing protein [Candidatus Sulfopaludibacter sp.]|nr:two-component regulator propeller domain-containing protein [Candidatus Sulfopaludibacter sp.]
MTDLNLERKVPVGLVVCLAGLALFVVRAGGANPDLAERAGAMAHWHTPDGLPSESVTAVIQTRDGFLWIGTDAGLVRFDGVKFTDLKLTASATDHPIHITALCENDQGDLWIGTQGNGLFELEQGTLRHFTTEQGLLDNHVTSLAAGSRGTVWIGSPVGLNLWTGERFKSFTTRDGLPDKFVSGVNVAPSGTVWITTHVGMCRFINEHLVPYKFQTESQGRSPEYLGVYEDRSGNLWAFGDTYLINLSENKRLNYFRSSQPANVRIWSLCEGEDGRLWIGTSGGGLFCFEDNRFRPVILGENRRPYDVRTICEDQEGNLWLGTSGGGLMQMRPESVHVMQAGQALPDSPPTALALGADGRAYVGLQQGGLFVGESGRFDRLGSDDGWDVENLISSVCLARDGGLWAGTLGDGLYGLRDGRSIHLTTADGLADDAVLAVCADSEGGIWASTSAGTIHRFLGDTLMRYDTTQGLPGTPVTVMIPSADGGLWLGTEDGQILYGINGNFRVIDAAKIPGQHAVLALHEGEQGGLFAAGIAFNNKRNSGQKGRLLWIGTDGGGLSCLAGGMAMNWNSSNGLPNDIVAGITEDSAGNLWLATAAGIYRVNRGDLRKAFAAATKRYSVEAGRQAAASTPLACQWISDAKTMPESGVVEGGTRAALAPDGELWFATSEGVLSVDARQSGAEPTSFPVYVENAAFNGQPPVSLLRGPLWSPAAKNRAPFRAPVDVRSLEVHFTALNFAAPEDVQFRHKLEGFDPDWMDDGVTRSARYGRLPYGHYRFRLAARDADGKWREATETFAFVVPTPLYFQSWAVGLYLLTGVALIAGIVRTVSHRRLRAALARLEQQQALERERMRIARDMHDEMGSKLTKISFLSERAQMDAKPDGSHAEKIEAIAQTSRELLKTMDEIVWAVNPRNDTLENLAAYLSSYAVEYFQNTRVECELRLPEQIPHFPLSSEMRHNLFLTFEEALNNVLKHSAATKARMEMTVNALEFELKVTDNGRGFDTSVSANGQPRGGRGGNGLKNMRQRLVAIGGDCQVSSQPGAGTTVTIRIRLNEKSAGKP